MAKNLKKLGIFAAGALAFFALSAGAAAEAESDMQYITTLAYEETDGDESAAFIDSGECGENVTWTLDDEGTLTISGTGDIALRRYEL